MYIIRDTTNDNLIEFMNTNYLLIYASQGDSMGQWVFKDLIQSKNFSVRNTSDSMNFDLFILIIEIFSISIKHLLLELF